MGTSGVATPHYDHDSGDYLQLEGNVVNHIDFLDFKLASNHAKAVPSNHELTSSSTTSAEDRSLRHNLELDHLYDRLSFPKIVHSHDIGLATESYFTIFNDPASLSTSVRDMQSIDNDRPLFLPSPSPSFSGDNDIECAQCEPNGQVQVTLSLRPKSVFQRPKPAHSDGGSTAPVTVSIQFVESLVQCSVCSTEYRGKYRTGNLARHKRHKHKGEVLLVCLDQDCNKVFKRQDARLKHIRKHHTELAAAPVLRSRAANVSL